MRTPAVDDPRGAHLDYDYDGEEEEAAAGIALSSFDPLYSYAELEHEAAGPTLVVGLWRLRPLPRHMLIDRDNLRVQICLAKAKAFGIKRTVHRISLAYADLVGQRTTITWVQD